MQCGITQGSSEITYLEIEIIDVRKSDTWSPYRLSFRWELLTVNGIGRTNFPVSVGTSGSEQTLGSPFTLSMIIMILFPWCVCAYYTICSWVSFLQL